MLVEGAVSTKTVAALADGAMSIANASLSDNYTGLTGVLLAYAPKAMREWLVGKRLTLRQLKAHEKMFDQTCEVVNAHFQSALEAASQAETLSEISLRQLVLEQARSGARLLAVVRQALNYLPPDAAEETEDVAQAADEDVSWWDTFQGFARRANETWRVNLLARALAENALYPGAIRLKALWEIGMLERDDYGSLAIFCNASLGVDGLPVMLLEPEEQNRFLCSLEGDIREANLAHIVADLIEAGLIRQSLTQIDATEAVHLEHASGPHLMNYLAPGAQNGDAMFIQIAAYSPVDRALDICRLYQTIPDAASDANFAALQALLVAESESNQAFGEIQFVAASDSDSD